MVIMNIIKECFFEKDWKLEDIRREVSASASSSASVSATTAEYNGFGKVSRLTERPAILRPFGNATTLSFLYGPDRSRWKTELKKGTKLLRTTLFGEDYEQVEADGVTTRYLYAGHGVVYVSRKSSSGSTGNYYYMVTDHLGSVHGLLDADGNRVLSWKYDAWGQQETEKTSDAVTFYRGYGGHEMLPEFGLINMNGRLYDPALGRFLSPDNYVQLPDFSQSFNRYSYCLNNPLKYTDPSGNFWTLAIGAAIGGFFNWASHGFHLNARGLGYFATGAIAGGVSAGLASGVSVAMAGGSFWSGAAGLAGGVSSTGFIAGAAAGASSGLAGGFVLGAGNAWVEGKGLGNGLLKGLESGGLGALYGGVTGGILGGIDALGKGTNFWTGKARLSTVGAYSCSHCMPADFELGEDTFTGTYVGKFEGVNVFESKILGNIEGNISAVTIPERGIVAAEGVFTSGVVKGRRMMQHEFGHILQYRKFGAYAYWHIIAPESLSSVALSPSSHKYFWTETWANFLSKEFFGRRWECEGYYPVREISIFNLLRMKTAKAYGQHPLRAWFLF